MCFGYTHFNHFVMFWISIYLILDGKKVVCIFATVLTFDAMWTVNQKTNNTHIIWCIRTRAPKKNIFLNESITHLRFGTLSQNDLSFFYYPKWIFHLNRRHFLPGPLSCFWILCSLESNTKAILFLSAQQAIHIHIQREKIFLLHIIPIAFWLFKVVIVNYENLRFSNDSHLNGCIFCSALCFTFLLCIVALKRILNKLIEYCSTESRCQQIIHSQQTRG